MECSLNDLLRKNKSPGDSRRALIVTMLPDELHFRLAHACGRDHTVTGKRLAQTNIFSKVG
jgi:hypothetical protein